ncbi:proline racemase family protein [Paraburkholderia hospita]|uniref:proline racemase family protein n=1 Tax=Paraburkholderia hospita TaxID=169430 RepID=UPI003BFA0991
MRRLGSGTAGRIAQLYRREQIRMGEVLVNEWVIGSVFNAEGLSEMQFDGFSAVIPRVDGWVFVCVLPTGLSIRVIHLGMAFWRGSVAAKASTLCRATVSSCFDGARCQSNRVPRFSQRVAVGALSSLQCGRVSNPTSDNRVTEQLRRSLSYHFTT